MSLTNRVVQRLLLPLAMSTALCVAMPSAAAPVYRTTDAAGNTVFTDRPKQGAEKIEVREVQTYSTPAPKSAPAGADSTSPQAEKPPGAPVRYKVIRIASPRDSASLRSNDGTVLVGVQLDPPLQDGHKLNVLLDGSIRVSNTLNTAVSIPNVTRGAHTVQAIVVDEKGARFGSSQPVSFHLQRQSVARAN